MGKVTALYICAAPGQAMRECDEVQALAGRGLLGDRYAVDQGTFSCAARQTIRHVTLIDHDAIVAANERLTRWGMQPFALHETRRNIVTEGIDVYALLGREFRVGGVRMRGIEPTRPCHIPSAAANKTGFREAFAESGGIRAAIFSDGLIALGDNVSPEADGRRPQAAVKFGRRSHGRRDA
jgi:hypothetical protein